MNGYRGPAEHAEKVRDRLRETARNLENWGYGITENPFRIAIKDPEVRRLWTALRRGGLKLGPGDGSSPEQALRVGRMNGYYHERSNTLHVVIEKKTEVDPEIVFAHELKHAEFAAKIDSDKLYEAVRAKNPEAIDKLLAEYRKRPEAISYRRRAEKDQNAPDVIEAEVNRLAKFLLTRDIFRVIDEREATAFGHEVYARLRDSQPTLRWAASEYWFGLEPPQRREELIKQFTDPVSGYGFDKDVVNMVWDFAVPESAQRTGPRLRRAG